MYSTSACACSNSDLAERESVVELAAAAIVAEYSDISPDDLELTWGPHQFSNEDLRPMVSQKIGADSDPCYAFVQFTIASAIVENKYTDENGACWVLRGPSQISVYVGTGGNTYVGSRNAFAPDDPEERCSED